MLKRSHLDKINEKWFCKVFCSLSIIIFALLLYYCLGGRGVNSGEVTDEHISFQKDSILFNLFLLGVVSVILHLYGKLEKFLISRKRRNILVAVVCVFAVLFGIYWVKTTCTYPQGDQEYVLVYARLFNAGDFSGLKDGEYLGLYPQQLGIVTFFRILRLLFGNEEYLMFQYLTAALLSAVIMSGTKVVRYISRENVKAELFYLLFVVTCFPMYAYTPFIYGDLISLEVGMIAVWAFLACLERMRVWRLVWFGISIGLAVFFECDRDADTTTKRAMEDLKSYINLYRNNPSYMVDFFTRKMLTQWNAPMYQCIVMNNRIIGEQGKIVRNIYEQGILFKWINNYMKIFQLVLYASILFLLIVKRREWGAIDKYLLLIAVIGGFFFSLMWEAKTRYVFPYMLMQLPYMAIGVNEVLKFIKAQFAKTKHIV